MYCQWIPDKNWLVQMEAELYLYQFCTTCPKTQKESAFHHDVLLRASQPMESLWTCCGRMSRALGTFAFPVAFYHVTMNGFAHIWLTVRTQHFCFGNVHACGYGFYELYEPTLLDLLEYGRLQWPVFFQWLCGC